MDPVTTNITQELPESVLATLAEIGEEINASLNLDRVLAKIAATVKRLIDYEIFSVMLLDRETQTLSHRFAIGHSREVIDHWRIPVGQGITGTAAATREPVRVSDVRNDPRYINAIDAVRSEMAVPLIFHGEVIGVLDMQSTQADYFTHEQQGILALLASRLAAAIENARLFERARSQARHAAAAQRSGPRGQLDPGRGGAAAPRRGAGQARDRLSDHEHLALRRGHEPVFAASGREVRPEPAGQAARGPQRGNHRRRGYHAAPGAGAGCDPGAALRDDQSGDALRTGDSHDPQGARRRRARSGEPAAELFHRGPRAGAFDSGGAAGGFAGKRAPLRKGGAR